VTLPEQARPENETTRRLFLAGSLRLAAGCVAVVTGQLLGGCTKTADSQTPAPLDIPLVDLPVGRRVRVDLGTTPVEVLRTAEGVVAKSLLCTHRGCIVKWDEQRELYQCPCHDGRFDAQGQVIFGPPTAPLVQLPVTVTETSVIVSG
jgi:cytochrome b6-f complex iron-sulfur subunit